MSTSLMKIYKYKVLFYYISIIVIMLHVPSNNPRVAFGLRLLDVGVH